LNNLYEILVTMGAVVISIVLVTLIFKYKLKAQAGDGKEGVSLEEKIASISNELSQIKEKQMQIPTAIAEGQLKGYQSVREEFAKVINAVNKQLNDVARTLNEQLSSTQGNISKNLDNASKAIVDVNKKLGSLSETAKEMREMGKDIGKLQDLLNVPKLRGNIGELFLENLIREIIPSENYELQYKFKTGTQVDAVIKVANGIIPVDSKFPLESFNRMRDSENEQDKKRHSGEFTRSVKERIDEIAAKYINPDEGTLDFALMYVPAENVYYEMTIGSDFGDSHTIRDYAWEKKVFPVSPNTFYTYLMVISMGLRGMRVEKNAENIIESLGEIQKLYMKFSESYSSMRKNINILSRKYDETERYREKIGTRLEMITGVDNESVENDALVGEKKENLLEKADDQ